MPSGGSRTRPASSASGTLATTSCTPSSATRRSRNSSTSGKLCPVSTCMTGNGIRAGRERLLRQPQHDDRVLAAGEQQHRPLELGHHLAHDEDALGLERVRGARRGSGASGSCGPVPDLSVESSDRSGYRQVTLQRRKQPRREILAADHQIGQLRVGLVVFQRRSVDPGSVQPGGRSPQRPARRSPTRTGRRRARRRRPRR